MARQSNASKVLIDLFEEHRQQDLADARHYIHHSLPNYDAEDLRTHGLRHLPDDERRHVRDLMWLYDHIGLLVAYRYAELEPVAAYLGGSIVDTWAKTEPTVDGERRHRAITDSADPGRYQAYFQALAEEIAGTTVTDLRKLVKRRKSSWWRSGGGVRTIAAPNG